MDTKNSGGIMPESHLTTGGKLQSFRAVLEAIIVAALIWTGSSMIDLKTQTAVVQSQLASLQTTLSNVPAIKEEQVRMRTEIQQSVEDRASMRADIQELRKMRGFR